MFMSNPPPGSDAQRMSRPLPYLRPAEEERTMLPPVSSLLHLDETERGILAEPLRPTQSRFTAMNHPLHLSEQDPSAPPTHIYQTHHQSRHIPGQGYSAGSVLVPMQYQGIAGPGQRASPPAQRRQAKKISQRKSDHPKVLADASSTAELSRYGEAEQYRRSVDQVPISQRRPNPPKNDVHTDASSVLPPSRYTASPRSHERTYAPLRPDTSLNPLRLEPSPTQVPQSATMTPPPLSSPNHEPKYIIRVRQQPLAARACGFGERDRRVVDPPPILQMSIEHPTAPEAELTARLRQPYSVVHCTILNAVTGADDSAMPGSTDRRQQRRLMGTLVTSAFVGTDENGVEGCFFTFPDLSVRTPGAYRLQFKLVVLDPSQMKPGWAEPVRATVISDAFNVYNAKDFGGMRPSTNLTKTLKHQGCLISVKKGNSKTNPSHGREDDDDDDDDEEEEEEEEEEEDDMTKGKAAKRGSKRQKR